MTTFPTITISKPASGNVIAVLEYQMLYSTGIKGLPPQQGTLQTPNVLITSPVITFPNLYTATLNATFPATLFADVGSDCIQLDTSNTIINSTLGDQQNIVTSGFMGDGYYAFCQANPGDPSCAAFHQNNDYYSTAPGYTLVQGLPAPVVPISGIVAGVAPYTAWWSDTFDNLFNDGGNVTIAIGTIYFLFLLDNQPLNTDILHQATQIGSTGDGTRVAGPPDGIGAIWLDGSTTTADWFDPNLTQTFTVYNGTIDQFGLDGSGKLTTGGAIQLAPAQQFVGYKCSDVIPDPVFVVHIGSGAGVFPDVGPGPIQPARVPVLDAAPGDFNRSGLPGSGGISGLTAAARTAFTLACERKIRLGM